MKINELLKPNEGFNLNEAQVAGSTSPAAGSELLGGMAAPPRPASPSHWTGLWYLLMLFLGSSSHPAELMGTCRFPVFSRLRGTWETNAGHPLWSQSNPRSTTLKSFLPHLTPFARDLTGNDDVREMGLDLCSPVPWEALYAKSSSTFLLSGKRDSS